jgi:hypothetical protein
MPKHRVLHWIFFLVLFCLVPLPFRLMEPGFAPALRIVMLAGILGAITIADGLSEITKIMLPLLMLQALLYPLLLWWTSGRVLRVVANRTSDVASAGFVAAFSIVLLVLSSFDIYVTPLSSTGRHTHLAQLLD